MKSRMFAIEHANSISFSVYDEDEADDVEEGSTGNEEVGVVAA